MKAMHKKTNYTPLICALAAIFLLSICAFSIHNVSGLAKADEKTALTNNDTVQTAEEQADVNGQAVLQQTENEVLNNESPSSNQSNDSIVITFLVRENMDIYKDGVKSSTEACSVMLDSTVSNPYYKVEYKSDTDIIIYLYNISLGVEVRTIEVKYTGTDSKQLSSTITHSGTTRMILQDGYSHSITSEYQDYGFSFLAYDVPSNSVRVSSTKANLEGTTEADLSAMLSYSTNKSNCTGCPYVSKNSVYTCKYTSDTTAEMVI